MALSVSSFIKLPSILLEICSGQRCDRSAPKSNTSKILCLSSLPASLMKTQSNEISIIWTKFKSAGASRAGNSCQYSKLGQNRSCRRYFQWTLSQLPFRFRRKSSKQIFKMAAMASIWDFLLQQFELFFIYKSPRCFLPSFESIGLSVQKKKGKIDFQDSRHLGFPTGMILAIFISTSHPNPSYQFSNQLALWFRKISKKKKSFKMAAMATILDFRSKQFKLF